MKSFDHCLVKNKSILGFTLIFPLLSLKDNVVLMKYVEKELKNIYFTIHSVVYKYQPSSLHISKKIALFWKEKQMFEWQRKDLSKLLRSFWACV